MPIEGGARSVIVVPFTIAVGGATIGSQGILVDAAGEWAQTFFSIPLWASGIKSIIVWAISQVAEADRMNVGIYAQGGGDNDPFGTRTHNVDPALSDTLNFAVNDFVKWTVYPTGAFRAGDTVQLTLAWTGGAAPNCATNAKFQNALVEFE